MKKISKRLADIYKKLPEEQFSVLDGVSCLKSVSKPLKFDESIDLHMSLAVDPRKSDQIVRGVVYPPVSLGKKIKVCVLVQGSMSEKCKEAGADFVGFEDIVQEIQKSGVFFDCCISTPEGMNILGKVAKILGPRGVMPSPKVGTVVSSDNLVEAIKKAKSGRVEYKADAYGMIHCGVGKISFSAEDITKNINSIVSEVLRSKPVGLKGSRYLTKIFLSSTMGPSVKIDLNKLEV